MSSSDTEAPSMTKWSVVVIASIAIYLFLSATPDDETSIAPQDHKASIASQDDETSILRDVWNGYMAYNKGADTRPSNGKLLLKGAVPASAMNSSVDQALPAYLACYDVLMVGPFGGDSKNNMCIYYIKNPITGRFRAQWRGNQKLSDLYTMMNNDGFVGN